MRDRFPLLLLGGLALFASMGWFLIQGARRGGFADQLSTFRSEPSGARALYLLLTESGLPVTRHQQDLTLIPPQRNFVLLGVRSAWLDETQPDAGIEAGDEDFEALGSSPLSEKETEKLLARVSDGATLVYAPFDEPPFFKDLSVSLERADASLEARTLVPAQPSRYVRGVEKVVTKVRTFLQLPPEAVPLLIDDTFEKPVAALIHHGQGDIIIIGAPELATNRTLGIADNAQFWHSLISTVSRTGPVSFDEFHHGFAGQKSMGEFAARYGLHFAVAQLLFGIMLWALALRRFGTPRPPADEVRVGSTDALFATSRLYREGKHDLHAASSIVKHLAADFAARAGVSPRLEPTEVGAALAVQGRKDLAQALLEVVSAANATQSDTDVEHVASLAAQARKTLNQHSRKAP